MNLQFVRTTDIQRNFKSILKQLHASDEPIVVLRDSVPQAVMLPYAEYKELASLKTTFLRKRMEEVWNRMRAVNAHITDGELNADIRRARQYAKRHR